MNPSDRILDAWESVAFRKGYKRHPDGIAFALGGVQEARKHHRATTYPSRVISTPLRPFCEGFAAKVEREFRRLWGLE